MLVRYLRLALLLSLGLLAGGMALAQQTGGITGVVVDSSGGVIAGALVQATNIQTNTVSATTTNSSGNYVLGSLLVGQYTLRVEKSGFKTLERPGIIININSALTLNLSLEVGSVRQEVTITGTPPVIDTENSELGNYRFTEQLENLPIPVREVQTLVGQTPGVPYGTGNTATAVATDTDTVGGTFNSSGSSGSAMQVLVDGGQLNPFQTTGYPAIDGIGRRADLTMPNTDMVSEFRLVTNGASAEYMDPVAIIVATKSGTNQLHGSAYEFYQSGGLAGNIWNIPTSQSFVRHQFGGSATGPIKKDKMFFAGAAEEFSHVLIEHAFARWPTSAERSGDLSDLLTLPTPDVLYNQLTGTPFPNNQIPASLISPVTTALLQLIPAAPAPPGAISNFNALYEKPEYDKSQKYDGRFDWDPNPSNLIFGRATIGRIDQATVYEGTVPGNYGFEVKDYYTQEFTGTWTHTLSPTSLFKLTFSRRSMPFRNTPTDGTTRFSVPIVDVTPAPPFAGPPAVTNGADGAGISDLTDRRFLNFSNDNDYQFYPSFHKTLGNHTLNTGFFFLHGYKSEAFAAPPWGQYTTASDYNNTKSTISSTGDAFADYLIGAPSTTDVTVGTAGGFLAKNTWSLYLQDDWKATTNLTLNLGLRYDSFGFFYPTDNRGSGADFGTGQIVIPNGSQNLIQPAFQSYQSLFITASQAGLPKSMAAPNNLDFAPRLGFAYRFLANTVARGGFGIFHNDIVYSQFSSLINQPPFTYQANLSRSLLIADGVNVNTQYTFQNPSASGSPAAAASAISGFTGFTPKYPAWTAYEYNLTLEKQFGLYAVTASYVGNLGTNLDRQVLVNACPPEAEVCTSIPAGTAGARKWPQFGTTFGENTPGGRSNYNAGNIEVSRQFNKGLLLDANFSYSRLLGYQYVASNPVANPLWAYDYGPVSAQPYKVFHFNHVYELPFGRGRRFGSNLNRVVDGILGGWKLSGVGTWESGESLTVLAGVGTSPTDATANRANRLCAGVLSKHTTAEWFNTSCYSVPAYINSTVKNPTRQFGTAGIGTVIGPGWFSYDSNLQKVFAIRGRVKLSLRVDSFNVFNHPDLSNPDVTASDSTFGQIRTAAGAYTPRTFQFGARLDF